MNIMFVHQNMPGQYREFVQWLVGRGVHNIVFLTQRKNAPKIDGVRTIVYKPHNVAKDDAYGLSRTWENATGSGFGAAQAASKLKDTGFTPDIIIGHVGWGELTFMKEVYPDTPIIGFFEYYYSAHGGPVGFDPESPVSAHSPYILAANNAVPLVNIEVVDLGHCPTYWQRDRFPESFHDKCYVCHDGIRTDTLLPDPNVELTLGRVDRALTRADDDIVTYMARNLETTRGFHQFMRALPGIQAGHPNARVLVIGGNDTSYGGKSKHPGGLRGQMEAEVGDRVDWSRVHFLGQVPFEDYQKIIQISKCHLYLSMPFVLSWSCLESMSMGATIVASDVAPVREAITHGETGLIVDFFDPDAIAAQVVDVLQNPETYAHIGPAARDHVVKTYDFHTVCLPEHIRQINDLVPEAKRMALP
ncbi:Phosphatidyl-myo-inositol mannosyltransferase [Ascidiaceihabitans donghaensis]|uniref:Phosphatidyl-myo-inositol mannosyltransferase n=1 Tax=Ascidiaceihabitans donghaensis TaxID=1510460 RepID=A0A2R8B8X3_9RHOB|nr:glycosyltransferase family 4 protein [Ascidiaceihabitans donghaensis]SPH19525.1 Phosphatidyl-myo-inositol mannosyltransferase [Ascidiaceihabitans donghaensis]